MVVTLHRVFEKLGWNVLDKALVETIAKAAQVDPDLARRYDERVDSWLHRVSRRGLWHGAFEGVASASDAEFFDAETMAALARNLVSKAYERGNCVIVGRGGQCILQDRKDVLHVFIYAPWPNRVARVQSRAPEVEDVEHLIRSTDQHRAEYIRVFFGCNRSDPHLYHAMLSSELGEETVTRIIIDLMAQGVKSCA